MLALMGHPQPLKLALSQRQAHCAVHPVHAAQLGALSRNLGKPTSLHPPLLSALSFGRLPGRDNPGWQVSDVPHSILQMHGMLSRGHHGCSSGKCDACLILFERAHSDRA